MIGTVKSEKRYVYPLVLLAICVLFFFRAINIDQDLPPYGIGFLYTADEGTYASMAINYENFGNFKGDNPDFPNYVASHVRMDMVGNALTIISMELFGDNYWGFRMPNIIMAFGSFVMILWLVYQAIKRQEKIAFGEAKWILPIVAIYFVCDFFMYNASKVWEPSIHRMFFVMFALVLCVNIEKHTYIKLFLLGASVMGSVLGVYLTNLFLFIPCGIFLLFRGFWNKSIKKFLKECVCFGLGALIVFAIVDIMFRYYWKISCLGNMLEIYRLFSSDGDYQVIGGASNIFITCITRFVKFFGGNILLYNLPVLALYLLQLPRGIVSAVKEKNVPYIFSTAAIFGFLLQTFFTEDFILRKGYIVYPLIILCIIIDYLKHKDAYFTVTGKWEKIYSVVVTVFVSIVTFYRLWGTTEITKVDFQTTDKLCIIVLLYLPTMLICMVKVLGKDYSFKRYLLKGALVVGICFNLVFLWRYVWHEPTYSERDMMIQIGEDCGDNYLAGLYSVGVSLYNDIKPIVARGNVEYSQMAAQDQDLKFIYLSVDSFSYIREKLDYGIMNGQDYFLMPIETYNREFVYYESKSDFSLYEVQPAEDVVAYYRDKYRAYVDGTSDEYVPEYYPDRYDVLYGVDKEIYTEICNNVYGDINADIFGNIWGDVHGDINATIHGSVIGNVYGNVNGCVEGKITGTLYGTDVNAE